MTSPTNDVDNGRGRGARLSDELRSTGRSMKWLVGRVRSTVGMMSMLRVGAMTLIGTVSTTIFGYSMLLIIRSSANDAAFNLRVISLDRPDWLPVPALLAVAFAAGLIGAILFYLGERGASMAAVAMGDRLRREVLGIMALPSSRGWHSEFDLPATRAAFPVIIGAVREITVAARYTVGLAAPFSVLALSILLLIVIEPVVTAVVAVAGLLYLLPLYLVTRSMSELNTMVETQQESTRALLDADVRDMVENPETAEGTVRRHARDADEAFHQRLLQPIRLRSLSVVLGAALAVLVYAMFELRTPGGDDLPVGPLILYLITLRFAASGGQHLANSLVQVSRRAPAIAQYNEFVATVDHFRLERQSRRRADAVPRRLLLRTTGGQSLTLAKGATALVVVNRPPSRTMVDSLAIAMEKQLEANGLTIDILGEARVVWADDPTAEHVQYAAESKGDSRAKFTFVVSHDPLAAVLDSEAWYTFVVSNAARSAFDKKLAGWDHVLSAVLTFVDGELKVGGDLAWAGEHRLEVLDSLRPPAPS